MFHEARRGVGGRFLGFLAAAVISALPAAAGAGDRGFVPDLMVSSTVPADGDLNPYGVAFVPPGFSANGAILPGDVLVSNFNNKKNLQGTGGTIVKLTPDGDVAPGGKAEVFFEGKGLGLTAALGFAAGFVVVGSLPTTDGTLDTAQPGALLFLDRNGNPPPASPFTNGINGPWGLAVAPASRVPGAGPAIFVSNVLSGTVVRLNLCGGCAPPLPVITSVTTIASGYTVQPNAAALVLGPTGLAYDPDADVLYIASTADNAIFAVAGARARQASDGPGTVVFSDRHLRGPLALIFVPNGDLIASNGDAVNAAARHPSSFIEFTTAGKFVREFNIDPVPGGAFGLAIGPAGGHAVRLAYVDDNTSTLTVLACRLEGC